MTFCAKSLPSEAIFCGSGAGCDWAKRISSSTYNIYCACMAFGFQSEPTSGGLGGSTAGLLQSCLHKQQSDQYGMATVAMLTQEHAHIQKQ